jgi:hypothetical protein
MHMPRLIFEENPADPDKIAVRASFVPNFEPLEPQKLDLV